MIRFGCQLENANRQFRMLDYSSNLFDKNESAIVNRKITFPRASIISYASEWQIYHATTRERIAGIAMDIPSGPGKLSRAYLSHCRASNYKRSSIETERRDASGKSQEKKISSRSRFWSESTRKEGGNAITIHVTKKSREKVDKKSRAR